MKDVPGLFADLTAALEDMHGIAVDGQRSDLPLDVQEVLIRSARTALDDVMTLVSRLMLAVL